MSKEYVPNKIVKTQMHDMRKRKRPRNRCIDEVENNIRAMEKRK